MTHRERLRQIALNHLRAHNGDIKTTIRSLHHTLTEYHIYRRGMMNVLLGDYLASLTQQQRGPR